MKNYKAVIFDMDGVLINSEPLWKIAETEILSSLGIPVTKEQIHNTSAMSVKGICEYWYTIHPWEGKSFEEIEDMIVARVIELIKIHDTKLPGVTEILKHFKSINLKIGLATNSSHDIIEVVLKKTEIKHYFSFIASAKDVEKGKPDPAIYLYAAKNLGINPKDCLVFEDSIVGVQAAYRAGMTVIAIPAKRDFDKEEFEIAERKISSLNEFRF